MWVTVVGDGVVAGAVMGGGAPMETPTMNRKSGMTKSARWTTSHGEWSIQPWNQPPTLSTKTISITLSPRACRRQPTKTVSRAGQKKVRQRERERVARASVHGAHRVQALQPLGLLLGRGAGRCGAARP